jgi:hypothetical protein
MSIERYEQSAGIALATAQDAAVTRLAEWAHSADAAYTVAQRLSDSAFVPQQFRGKPVETTAAILAGLEVGLSPMQAIRSFDIIQGTAAPRAITLRALVQSQGHEMILVESSPTRCKMKGRRRDSSEWQNVTWTIERARDLGLVGKDNWKKQPAAMLVARATSELARLIASDAILGIGYSVEEIADGGAYEQQVGEVTATAAAAKGTRKMSRAIRVVQADEPDADPEPEVEEPIESPKLNTSSGLAKTMFATFNEAGITDRDARLAYVSDVTGCEVTSSSDMTDADAEQVTAALRADLEQPFPEQQ